MKTIIKIIAALIIAAIILIVGLVVLIGAATNEVSKSIEGDHAKGAEYAMSADEFHQIKPGVEYHAFIEKYGKPDPDKTQRITVAGSKDVTVYYNVEGGDLLDSYQFSFTNGTLSSKAKW